MASSYLSFDEWEDVYADRIEHLRRSAVRDLFAAISRPNVIGLSGGSPDISSLPLDEVAECAKRVVTENGLKSLQYGGSDGRIETRTMVADMLAEDDIHVDPDEIIITGGSQQALDFMGRVFINPGDKIIVEGPSYLGALQAFSAYQPDVEVVPMDGEGMRMDALEETLKRLGPRGAKFIYTIPNFQNPAGVTMTLERRKRLLELAREYHIQVIEDDPYGRLRFEGEHIPPLKSMDPNVIYLGTTSKIFAPGLRLAWCVAPKPVIAKINLCEQGASLCCSAFNQILAEQYFGRTDWKGTLEKSKAIYRSRRDAMISALEEFFPPEATWTHPQGGLFVYVTLPPYFDTEQMMSAALENGVAYVPGSNCFPNGEGKSSMRLAFSYEPEEKIREGVRRLSEVIADRMELYRAFLKAGALPEASSEGM
ncbi:MAG: PLP-dependent aminotransferase family protein [Atopobiaceae bacterium]|uniref:PLP-dependent aminotransferase family protein n=1 Tax=Muricaecibacterium torontonense TaxID=3032871 RepID=A0A4S2F2Y1_9ACTN|nr:PLP-dependent aminotransferase family protein [Muricaecibacterium torontonense]MCI8676081.1 PLP-dependent aminotransferase family protein [Atopobiaceae bacterium]TGY63319.1 PLP-dependent aminotransferase family protein [Muricaecibacterium torontonense]